MQWNSGKLIHLNAAGWNKKAEFFGAIKMEWKFLNFKPTLFHKGYELTLKVCKQ